jgi:hypothetical protein
MGLEVNLFKKEKTNMLANKLMPYLFLLIAGNSSVLRADSLLTPSQERVIKAADLLMNEYEISYVYGGHQVGDAGACQVCNQCLEMKVPVPNKRLTLCPECQKCSIDCSHFAQLTFSNAGFSMPYLPTEEMLALSKKKLKRNYKMIDIGSDSRVALPGDLLVYPTHVVMLEKNYLDGHGDIIHATGGGEIRIPGQGIQRKRRTPLASLGGPLQRILRHQDLMEVRQLKRVE